MSSLKSSREQNSIWALSSDAFERQGEPGSARLEPIGLSGGNAWGSLMRTGWIGVAGREHVRRAVEGGFCQLNHGRDAPVRRLSPGDLIVYYSPREGMRSGEPLQAFTAIGEVLEGEPYQVDLTPMFRPVRRDVRYFDAVDASIRPLLGTLSFTKGRRSWGQELRRGTFAIDWADCQLIARAMGVADELRD